MTLGERIKKVRKELDLTQQEFADKIGTTRNNIAGYETRRREPSTAVINLIITKLNVSEEWLRTGEGEMFIQRAKELVQFEIPEQLARIIGIYNDMNAAGQEKLFGYAEDLSINPKYKKERFASNQPAGWVIKTSPHP